MVFIQSSMIFNKGAKMKAITQSGQLTQLERILLVVPLLGGAFFGVFPFILGGASGPVFGFSGNDSFIYRLAGAAAFGYAVALFMGIRAGDWIPLRFVIIATLVFNLGSLYACLTAIGGGASNFVIYAITFTSILIVLICVWLLYSHREPVTAPRDLTQNNLYLLMLAAAASGLFGVLALFVPVVAAHLFGFQGTDVFVIQQGGAATLGYVAMALLGLRFQDSVDMRLPTIMAFVFNGLSFIASILALLAGEPILITILIGVASGFFAAATGLVLRRNGVL